MQLVDDRVFDKDPDFRSGFGMGIVFEGGLDRLDTVFV